ncbi:MAG TPA: hypothetical protein VHZ03_46315 [Trebonia sp.]|jgi:hypothetical protein|nr:hypothetical protein [Trebonia sp.]
MTAQLGADGLDPSGDPYLELLFEVARVQPESGRPWVHLINQLGFHSTQRLSISDVAGGVVVATWPAELTEQANYLYGRGLGSALVTAALEQGWTVDPSPHLAYYTAPLGKRLFMRPPPSVTPLDYVACWQDKHALRRVGNHNREDVEHELWPWLKQQGFADDGDDALLERFLGEFLGNRSAQLRPGLRFTRVWTSAEVAGLDSALADTIRSQFDVIFAAAHEPPLRSKVPVLGAPYRQAQVTEQPGSRDPFSVDPTVVERGLRGHADTQNELANVLRNAGIEPRSSVSPQLNFDLAWERNGTVFVAEVKSVTAVNEEEQLRLGLGQILRYRQRLARRHDRVVAVLVPERQPADPSWRELCQELGVVLLGGNQLRQAPALDMP